MTYMICPYNRNCECVVRHKAPIGYDKNECPVYSCIGGPCGYIAQLNGVAVLNSNIEALINLVKPGNEICDS